MSSTINETQLQETSDFMYKLLLAIGIIVMFIVGTIIGIKFMISSAEDKAKVKESLVPYIVGCAVIFGAFTIWSIAVNIGQDMTIQMATVSKNVQCTACNKFVDYNRYITNGNKCFECGNYGGNTPSATECYYICKNCGEVFDWYRISSNHHCSGCGSEFENWPNRNLDC